MKKTLVALALVVVATACSGSSDEAARGASTPTVSATPSPTPSPTPSTLTLQQAAEKYLQLVKPVLVTRDALGNEINADNINYKRVREAAARYEAATRLWNTQLLQVQWPATVAPAVQALVKASAEDIAIVRRFAEATDVDSFNNVVDSHEHSGTGPRVRGAAELVRTYLGLPSADR